MDSPFPYDKFVTGKHFIGRKTDCAVLTTLIAQHGHAVLYEPPKTGKTSLIQQVLQQMRYTQRDLTASQFTVLDIRTADAFLARYGATVVRMVAATPAEYGAVVQQYLGGTHFVFDPTVFAEREEILSHRQDLDEEDIKAVLRLPFRLAADRGVSLLTVIEEFQNINETEDGDRILRLLDAVIREEADAGHKGFSFIFCGSMVNAMRQIFETGRLFHTGITRVRLSLVEERDIADHILRGFLSGGKVLDRELLFRACRLLKNNLWYVNHFASICDALTKGYVMEPVLLDAVSCLLSVHEPRFRALMNSLTTHQVHLLQATLEGNTQFSSTGIIRKYDLHSSANVKRVKDALMKKEILVFDEQDQPSFQDPLFEYWIRKYFFGLPD